MGSAVVVPVDLLCVADVDDAVDADVEVDAEEPVVLGAVEVVLPAAVATR